jgi:hypothetical protein
MTIKNRAAQWVFSRFSHERLPGYPVACLIAPQELRRGDVVCIDRATGKLRKYVAGEEGVRPFTLPAEARQNGSVMELPDSSILPRYTT